jgi:hypothetical protein
MKTDKQRRVVLEARLVEDSSAPRLSLEAELALPQTAPGR